MDDEALELLDESFTIYYIDRRNILDSKSTMERTLNARKKVQHLKNHALIHQSLTNNQALPISLDDTNHLRHDSEGKMNAALSNKSTQIAIHCVILMMLWN